MSWVGVGVGAASLVGSIGTSLYGSSRAEKAQRKAAEEMNRKLDAAKSEIEMYAGEYTNFLTRLDTEFDPYDVEDAFNSLYEAVIQPMERDFDENVLPGIQAAYSGGIMGQGAALSGAAASAESSARRGLSEKKADLRYQERGNAINRNYADFERRANLAGAKFSAQTAAPSLSVGIAGQQYQAQTDTIAAKLAANQQIAGGIQQIGSLGMAAANAYQGRQQNISLQEALNGRIPSTGTADKSMAQYRDYTKTLGR